MLSNAEIDFFPKGLENFIPIMKLLILTTCGLKEVTQQDLSPFMDLEDLDLSMNLIQSLEPGLFIYNPQLETILLYENLIMTVGADVFRSLRNLRRLTFGVNRCYSGQANNRLEVVKLIGEIRKKCNVVRVFRSMELTEERNFRWDKKSMILLACAVMSIGLVIYYSAYRFCWTDKIE